MRHNEHIERPIVLDLPVAKPKLWNGSYQVMFLTGLWSFIPSKYYEKEALLADPVCGPILASLLGEFLQSYFFIKHFALWQCYKR